MATMISGTSERERQRKYGIGIAVALSVLVHLLFGFVFRDYWATVARLMHVQTAPPHPRELATSTIIRIEKRVVPAPKPPEPKPVAKLEPVRPQPVVVVQPRVAVAQQPTPIPAPPHPTQQRERHVLSKPNVTLPKLAYAKPSTGSHERSDFEKPSAAKAGLPKRGTVTYSQEDLDNLNANFARTIAATRNKPDLAPVQVKAPAAIHRSSVSFEGMQGDLHVGQGYINPIVAPTYRGQYVFYYTHYKYMWPDGHLEEDDIPWVFVYLRNQDPFASHQRTIPLQAPPPDYVPNRPLQPVLQAFFPKLYPNAPEARTAD